MSIADATGEVIGTDSFGNEDNTYGAASYSVHVSFPNLLLNSERSYLQKRGHLIKELYDATVQHNNISVRFNARVQDVDPGSETSPPSVTLKNGETISGDVVVVADGVKSVVRSVVTGQSDRAVDTGDAAYRSVYSHSLTLALSA